MASVILLASCQEVEDKTADFSHCPYDQPEPVFYPALAQISDHQFRRSKHGSEESFRLAGDIEVQLLQSGCEYRSQEFRFELPPGESCRSASDCLDLVSSLLQMLARLGPEYHSFRAWAQAIQSSPGSPELGVNKALDERFWIRIERRQAGSQTTLSLLLSEDPDR